MLVVISIGKLKTLKHNTFSNKTVFCIICNMCGNKDEKIFKEKEPIKILTIFSLIKNM